MRQADSSNNKNFMTLVCIYGFLEPVVCAICTFHSYVKFKSNKIILHDVKDAGNLC
jgi:hypothetical protein